MCSGDMMVSFLGVYLYYETMYFRDGSDPMCCTLGLTVYSHSSAVWIFARLRLLSGDIRISEAEFACYCVRVWCGCNKEVDVGIDGA